jgi:hypothetical protein
MGPNPEDVFPHASPLGFSRLPAFLSSLSALETLDISLADARGSGASLSNIDLSPLSRLRDVRLTLRADTSARAVAALPPSVSAVSGLASLALRGFTFEDAGGWATHAAFDLGPLAACGRLAALDLQLGTWEAEHCESFQVPGLSALTALTSLEVTIGARLAPAAASAPAPHTSHSSGKRHASSTAGGAAAASRSDTDADTDMGTDADLSAQEVLLSLPAMPRSARVRIASSMRVVLRNSKALARAKSPGVLAHSIMLEEPMPQRRATADTSGGDAGARGAAGSRDQSQRSTQQPATCAGTAPQDKPGTDVSSQQQWVRAPAHVVIGALRDLWPGVEVWRYPMQLPGLSTWQDAAPELLCQAAGRDKVQAQLAHVLVAAALACGGDCSLEAPPERGHGSATAAAAAAASSARQSSRPSLW